MTYVLAAAGTGGHVYPAIAVAESLLELGVDRGEISFFGGERMEADAVIGAGFSFVRFDLPRLRRSITLENLRIPIRLRRTARAMAAEMRGRHVRVVLGMSGYVTVPASMAARRTGAVSFVQEQNSVAGLATRFASRSAQGTFLGLPGSAERLPRSEITGNPLRRAIRLFDRDSLRAEALARYEVAPGTMVLGIMGGSLGAAVINEQVARVAGGWSGPPVTIVHLTGPEAFEEMARRAAGSELPWRCRAYEERMDLFYAAADAVVSRAGAMTISELAATGSPSVLVPLARVGQTANARAASDAGAALLLDQDGISRLGEVAAGVLADRRRLEGMAAAARVFARPEAASAIARRLREAADG